MTESAPAAPAAIPYAAEITAAQAKGDTAEANRLYQLQQGIDPAAVSPAGGVPAVVETAERPDATPAGAEAATIASPTGYGAPVAVVDYPPAEVDDILTAASAWDGWNGGPEIADLRARWGNDAGRNIGLAAAYSEADAELAGLVQRYRLAGHPFVIEAAALLGRRHMQTGSAAPAAAPGARRSPQPQRTVPVATMSDEGLAAAMRGFNARIAEAQAEGNNRLANKIYQEQQAYIGQATGDAPIVGTGGRYA